MPIGSRRPRPTGGFQVLPEWVVPSVLARSSRPGYPGERGGSVPADVVDRWLEEVRALGIHSILCLLDDAQLAYYDSVPGGLLEHYRRSGLRVGHIPVMDLQSPPIPAAELEEVGRVFASLPKPVLIHCSAGMDRTGAAVEYILRKIES